MTKRTKRSSKMGKRHGVIDRLAQKMRPRPGNLFKNVKEQKVIESAQKSPIKIALTTTKIKSNRPPEQKKNITGRKSRQVVLQTRKIVKNVKLIKVMELPMER